MLKRAALLLLIAATALARDPNEFAEMRWRMIGPFRGGRTVAGLGLRDGQQIPMIAVDPRDPNRLYVAVLGHPYGPNEERGIFRSTDGGNTFQRVLYKDENTGGMDVAIDPANPDTVYAVLWQARQGPWENA